MSCHSCCDTYCHLCQLSKLFNWNLDKREALQKTPRLQLLFTVTSLVAHQKISIYLCCQSILSCLQCLPISILVHSETQAPKQPLTFCYSSHFPCQYSEKVAYMTSSRHCLRADARCSSPKPLVSLGQLW